jgi:hypothetical protein
MTSTAQNVVQFVISVGVIAVISQVVKAQGVFDGGGTVVLTIKGFLTFFSLALLYFPISLMLGGIPYRNRFFKRG